MARWSVAATATFISRNFVLHRTVAPASLHTLAKVLSGPPARIRNLPEWGHAARCLPNTSNMLPHSHLDSVMSNGSRNLSKTRARKSCGSTLYSSPVGAPWKTALEPGPEWDLKWAWFAGHDWTNTTVSLKWYSREEDPWYCQPCCHSPGSLLNRWATPRPQLVPPWTSHEPTTVQHHGSFV